MRLFVGCKVARGPASVCFTGRSVARASSWRLWLVASWKLALLLIVPPRAKRSFNLGVNTLRHFPPDKRYLIGVSGGRDSIALLHWLRANGYSKLIVCHLDHRLRGRKSAADAKFVERLANSLDVPFAGGAADVRALAQRQKQSIETAARAARFQFFATIARRRRCLTIFLGHHADDLVETFLINLFRGAGLAGLGGIRESSIQRVNEFELTMVRPLLGVWREQIDEYIRAHRLKFREDASNRELTPLRNRLRHRVIPYLEKIFGRKIRQNIWRTAMIAGDENAWMNGAIEPIPANGSELSVGKLRAEPVAVQRRILQQWLRQQDVANVGYDLIERVRALLEPEAKAAKTNLPGARHVRRRAKKLFIDG